MGAGNEVKGTGFMSKKKILFIEANSGISGDMFVAALLDLGAPKDVLLSVLDTIPVDGFRVGISRKKRAGIEVCDFDVRLDHEHENNDHNMEYLYGHTHGDNLQEQVSEHMHEHPHYHEQEHSHGHDYEHDHDHTHAHRGLKEVRDILTRTQMTDSARATANRVFEILAKAEAKAHGTTPEEVHFHEVGAVDSIVDIIAAAVCVDELAPDRVVVSSLTEGSGTVRTRHGILPIPVPAVANIVADNGLVLRQGPAMGEMVTPTGAAIVAAIRTDEMLPGTYRIGGVGIGGGKREYDPPSMVRAMWVEECEDQTRPIGAVGNGSGDTDRAADASGDTIWKLETDIDDCTGEELGYVMERLYTAGAREVHFTPIFMKKNRPAYELTVIVTDDKREELEGILFKETTTIGIRRQEMERTILPREEVKVATPYGEVKAKKVTLPDGEERIYPEYESMKKLAEEKCIPLVKIKEEF